MRRPDAPVGRTPLRNRGPPVPSDGFRNHGDQSKLETTTNGDRSFDPFADDPLFTADQAAEYLKVGRTTIHKWRHEKRIPCVKFFSDVRFRRSDLNRFVERNID